MTDTSNKKPQPYILETTESMYPKFTLFALTYDYEVAVKLANRLLSSKKYESVYLDNRRVKNQLAENKNLVTKSPQT